MANNSEVRKSGQDAPKKNESDQSVSRTHFFHFPVELFNVKPQAERNDPP